jgi:hypothetical protein
MTSRTVANLPSAPEKALICVNVVLLFHSIIGHEFTTTDEMHDTYIKTSVPGSLYNTNYCLFFKLPDHLASNHGEKLSFCGRRHSRPYLAVHIQVLQMVLQFDGESLLESNPGLKKGLATQKSVYEEAMHVLASIATHTPHRRGNGVSTASTLV